MRIRISGSNKLGLRFVLVLAQQENEDDHHQSNEQQTRQKTTPYKPVNHVFGLKIQRASGAASRGLLQDIATIPTRLCAHGRWSTDRIFSKEMVRDLLLNMRCTTLLAQYRFDSLGKVFGMSQDSRNCSLKTEPDSP